MKHAVIVTGGKQYRVAEGEVVFVEKLAANAGDTVTFDQVLCVVDDENTVIGTPVVEGASVTANVLKTGKTVCAGFSNLFCAMAEAAGIGAVISGAGRRGKEIRLLQPGQEILQARAMDGIAAESQEFLLLGFNVQFHVMLL